MGAASEVTVATNKSSQQQYNLTVSGAPRNLRIGVVTQMVYLVQLRNVGATDTTGVTVTDALPPGLGFSQSIPPPNNNDSGLLTFNVPQLPAGGIKLFLIEGELLQSTPPGVGLSNTVTVVDDQGNFAQGTFTGSVRAGSPSGPGKLDVALTTVSHTIVGSKLKSTLAVNNGGRSDAHNVVLTLDGPPDLAFSSAIPGPTSIQKTSDNLRLTWKFATVAGPGKAVVKLTQVVPDNATSGTTYTLTANVSADDGRTSSDTATIQVR